ncbi:hypothetical protein CEQ90_20335, partial [Lewinellaceae bacterium SD302]
QERSYIAKFNQVRLLTENEIDFDLAPLGGNFRKGLSAVFLFTLIVYYGFILTVVTIIVF